MRVLTKCPKGQPPRKQDNAGYTMGLPHMYPAFFVDGHSHMYPAKLRWRPQPHVPGKLRRRPKTPPAKLRRPADRPRRAGP